MAREKNGRNEESEEVIIFHVGLNCIYNAIDILTKCEQDLIKISNQKKCRPTAGYNKWSMPKRYKVDKRAPPAVN